MPHSKLTPAWFDLFILKSNNHVSSRGEANALEQLDAIIHEAYRIRVEIPGGLRERMIAYINNLDIVCPHCNLIHRDAEASFPKDGSLTVQCRCGGKFKVTTRLQQVFTSEII